MSMKTKLQTNNTDLQSILDIINALPEEMIDAYAVINVTYPEGSVCTCSNGNKTLELDNTLGYGFFLMDEGGEWTVSCTDGTNTKSESVSITAEGQWKSVTLSYQFVLFADGVVADGYSGSANYVIPAIDVTNYTTLEVEAMLTWANATTDFRVGLSSASNVSGTNPPAAYLIFSTTRETKTLDISGLTGPMYLGFFIGPAFGNFTTIAVSDGVLVFTQNSATAAAAHIIFK